MYISRLVIIFCLVICVFKAESQNALWKPLKVSKGGGDVNTTSDKSLPKKYAIVALDLKQFRDLLMPLSLKASKPATIKLPLPDGQTINVLAKESSIWQNGKNELIPDVKTYQLINPSNHSNAGRMTVTSEGVSGILFNGGSNIYIAPYSKGGVGQHLIYDEKEDTSNFSARCGTEGVEQLASPEVIPLDKKKEMPVLFGTSTTNDAVLRTYRIAVAATGEYTVWAGSVANAMKYITITMNNVQAIYDREFTIHFTLVTTPGIIYTDSTSDPYPTYSFPAGADLSANIAALNNVIGISNYDVGIVFNAKWDGGLANVGVVCNANKGGAGCGISTGIGANPTLGPQGSGMDRTAAHEIGHLFGATHTMSAGTGRCSGNITSSSAWEPGGGSTIMAYGGVCTGAAYQNSPDGYFHGGSIGQVKNYAINKGTCAVQEMTGNNMPILSVPATAYTIPKSTPFILKGYGNDVDGDSLTYSWEEMNAGVVTNGPPTDTGISGPQFRSYPPSPSGNIRIFPRLQNVLLGTVNPYEVLPAVGRTLNFRLTVRDNSAMGGAVNNANVSVVVYGGSGPFVVTSQTQPVTWTADGSSKAAVTWNVANTNLVPVGCSVVNVLFSADGGLTFPYILAASVPNNGVDTFLIPSIPTQNGRLKVEAVGNIFFSVNESTVTILSSCAAEGSIISPSDSVNTCPGSSLLNLSLSPKYSSPLVISGTLKSSDPSMSLTVFDSAKIACAKSGNTSKYNVFPFVVNKSGKYTFTRPTGNANKMISVYEGVLDTKSTCTGFLASNGSFTGKNTISETSNISVNLVAGTTYTLVIGTFSGSFPALPSSYTINVTPPTGGKLYSGNNLYLNPGAGYSYLYLIIDKGNNSIKSIVDSVNLIDTSQYTAGRYGVYGLSVASSDKSSLSSLLKTNFNTFQTLIQQGRGGICGNLSKNSVSVTISQPVNPIILVSGNTTICQGDSVNLVSNKNVGNQWYKDGVLLNAATKQSYLARDAGSYSVSVNSGGGCIATSVPRQIAVNPLPATPLIVRINNVLTSSYPVGNKWLRNDTLIGGATAASYTLPNFFTYNQCFKLIETDANKCSNISTPICFYSGGLPIKFNRFIVSASKDGVLLDWETALNATGYFEIEKSGDGINFFLIGTKPMNNAGQTVNTYSFNDNSLTADTKVSYYRIKSVETNGGITYSAVVSLKFYPPNYGVKLFPNPAHATVSVIGLGIKEIRITDVAGKAVLQQTALDVETRFDISHFACGVYLVSCKTVTGGIIVHKLLVK